MIKALTMAAGIFGVVATVLHREGLGNLSLFFAVLTVIALVGALYTHLGTPKSDSNVEERKNLFNSALKTIDARTRLTVEIVGEFREIFRKYRYAITEEQKELMEHLLSAIGDVRINDEELKDADLPKEEREKLIYSNRELLDKIEKARLVIEQYLSEST